MTYLIIGGAGYIGSHTTYELIEKGNEVVILDNFSSGSKNLVHPKAKLYNGDLKDKKILDVIFEENEKIEIIINFAASIIVNESVSKPLKYYLNNTFSTMVLLEAMKKYHKKFLIFSSTAAVYGLKTDKPILEEDELNPINPYGKSKLMSEIMIQDFAKSNKINFAILRYFNVAGARQDNAIGLFPKEGHKITHLIPAISSFVFDEANNSLNIYGDDYETRDGTCVRDYVHVQDLAKAHHLAAEYIFKNKEDLILNVGSKKGFSVLEVIKMFEKLLNKTIKYKISKRREGDPPFLVANSEKILKKLNFKNDFDLENIVKTELAWRKKCLKEKENE